MLKYPLFIVAITILCAVNAHCAEPKSIAVAQPHNKAALSKAEVDTIWLTIENATKINTDSSSQFRFINRKSYKQLLVQLNIPTTPRPDKHSIAQLKPLSYLILSNINIDHTSSKLSLNIVVMNCADASLVPLTDTSQLYPSLSALLNDIPSLVAKIINSMRIPSLNAVLFPTVISAACPDNIPELFHKKLVKALLNTKIRLVLLDDIMHIFKVNNIDPMQPLKPSLYNKVAAQLQAKNLVMSQISKCSLSNIPDPKKRKASLPTANITGSTRVVSQTGELVLIRPFDININFNDPKLAHNAQSWNKSQFIDFILESAVSQITPDIARELW